MAEKSKILIIGETGCIEKFVVETSAKSGHPTFALVRERALFLILLRENSSRVSRTLAVW
ncbi:hypothetical protein CsSME_00022846 [Camellia sinensis var. sinensis]